MMNENTKISKNTGMQSNRKKSSRDTGDKKIQSPHDRAFEYFFKDTVVVKSFLHEYLPEKIKNDIDFNSLRITGRSFIDKKMKRAHSDLLYEVKIRETPAYIYFLFEHKSWLERFTALQILRYMSAIWEDHIKRNKEDKHLPVIIPMVIYHGQDKWEIGQNFSFLFDKNEDLQEYIPDFKYDLYDISHMADEEIKGEPPLQLILMTFKYVSREDIKGHLESILSYFLDFDDIRKLEDMFDALMIYLEEAAGHLSEDELTETVLKSIEKGGEKMHVVARKLVNQGKEEGIKIGIQRGIEQGIQRGIQRGIEQGIQRGIEKKNLELIKNSIEMGFDVSTISKLTGLTVKQVNDIKNRMGRLETTH